MEILILLLCLSIATIGSAQQPKPHIIFILADDLGYNDVGFHGSNQIPTPNIDALAYTGIILDNYYVAPVCTPTRAAIMTGKYPIHTGMQHSVILGSTPYGLGLNEKLLPQYLKINGYTTRAIGKWHLGHFRKEYTPEFRGFDSHYGYWLGRQDYYDHSSMDANLFWGYDFKRGLNSSWDDYANYSTDLYTEEAVKIIREHDTSKPLFLYMAYQAVHSGNIYNHLQAPPEVIDKFSYIKDENRRKFAGMLSAMDYSIGEIISALSERDILDNAIIVFSTDNGGPAAGFDDNAASNWPLRGVKATLWQGGVKAAGFIWSPLLPSGVISKGLMHAADWLPTLLHAATGKDPLLTRIDGQDMWKTFSDSQPSGRNEVLLNIDPIEKLSGLIHRNWKLVKGRARGGDWDKWYGPSARDEEYNWAALWACKAAKSLNSILPLPAKTAIEKLRQEASLSCNSAALESQTDDNSTEYVYLFDISKDPCETHNLANTERARLDMMNAILQKYMEGMAKPRNKKSDPRSHPKYFGYQWVNWMDYM
ncbi:UNVERIFIED_CONTAM: hypothetical protein PYX00_001860 [Menopon gallinae]|uniref:Sulfatase N-terminal domain-containing protein n=1 Tax=Menopon gallinae TaxID=328185 RepID=A0AAW2IFV9_9NEOP